VATGRCSVEFCEAIGGWDKSRQVLRDADFLWHSGEVNGSGNGTWRQASYGFDFRRPR
jgi:hypothetical protein